MKYILMIIVIFCFGLMGYINKQKIKNKYKFLTQIIEYINFYDSNLSVFKNDLLEINNKYIIMQNNKNAKQYNLIIQNNNLYMINYEILKMFFSKDIEYNMIVNFFKTIGMSEYEEEKIKNLEIEKALQKMSNKILEDIKNKGDMVFKILLSIGAVIALLIW